MIKALVMTTAFSIFIIVAIGFLNHEADVSAMSGCCKQRHSYRDSWYRNGWSFTECERANRNQDADNIFEESGFFWWDRSCS